MRLGNRACLLFCARAYYSLGVVLGAEGTSQTFILHEFWSSFACAEKANGQGLMVLSHASRLGWETRVSFEGDCAACVAMCWLHLPLQLAANVLWLTCMKMTWMNLEFLSAGNLCMQKLVISNCPRKSLMNVLIGMIYPSKVPYLIKVTPTTIRIPKGALAMVSLGRCKRFPCFSLWCMIFFRAAVFWSIGCLAAGSLACSRAVTPLYFQVQP